MEQPMMGRPIVDNNMGMSNIYGKEELRKTMIETFDKIINELKDHCGPNGNYAILVDPLLPTSQPTFTKDGINIVKAMNFGSAIENVIRRMAIHIGSSIDRVSGDGTTSSIILSLGVLRSLMADKTLTDLSYGELVEKYNRFVARMVILIAGHTHLPDHYVSDSRPLTEVIKTIAYHQAYSSSHGDTELAELAAELFSSTPSHAWDNIVLEHAKKETSTKYTLMRDEAQYSLSVNIMSKNMCNAALQTEFTAIEANMLTIPVTLSANTPMFANVINLIESMSHLPEESTIPDTTPLVIITRSGIDTTARQQLLQALAEHHKASPIPIAIFTHHADEPLLNDMTGLCLVCGHNPNTAATLPALQPGVEVRYKNGTLELNNLYMNQDGSSIHPLVGDKTFPVFDETLETITTMIDNIQTEEVSTSNKQQVTKLRKLYNKLYLTNNVTILAGGNLHDMASAYDLVEDVIRACRSSLVHGFCAGGNHIFRCNNDINPFAGAYSEAAKELAYIVGVPSDSLTAETFNVLTGKGTVVVNAIEAGCDGSDGYPAEPIIIQPANISTEILKRFGELALRLINSSKIVTPGGLVRGAKNE